MNLQLKHNANMQVVGPTGCGKTYFVCKLLERRKDIFDRPLGKIHWLYGAQDGENGETSECMKKLHNINFVHGIPTEENWIAKHVKPQEVIVIDDLFLETAKRPEAITNLVTRVARHRGVFVIFITQNLFHQGGMHRTRNLNMQYVVLFKNPRDCTAIDYLSRQIYPTNRTFLVDVFEDVTKNKPHSYLFLDFTQNTPDDLRVRSNIFAPNGWIVYKQDKDTGITQ